MTHTHIACIRLYTLRDTKTAFIMTKRYDENPRSILLSIPYPRLNCLKTIPSTVTHTHITCIRLYTLRDTKTAFIMTKRYDENLRSILLSIPYPRLNCLKTIPSTVPHTHIACIRLYTLRDTKTAFIMTKRYDENPRSILLSIPYPRLNCLKTIPSTVTHTNIAFI